MTDRSARPRAVRMRGLVVGGVALLALLVLAGQSIAIAAGQGELAAVRDATDQYHDLGVANDAGFGEFYVCTDENSGLGAMGQHYVNLPDVLDSEIDALTPEALVYEPRPNGSLRLVGVEYVVFKAGWDASHGNPPQLFGRNFTLVPAGNRYGLDPFYELHVWLWRPNPSGMFQDWNPSVTCRGNGDPA
jgi:hypothetical protein